MFQIFGLESLLGSDLLWPLLLGLTAVPAVLQTVLLHFCPESPRYLLISLNQEEEARKGQTPLLCSRVDQSGEVREHYSPEGGPSLGPVVLLEGARG